jgi:hypothetical protein
VWQSSNNSTRQKELKLTMDKVFNYGKMSIKIPAILFECQSFPKFYVGPHENAPLAGVNFSYVSCLHLVGL